jgi:hypothetical protein
MAQETALTRPVVRAIVIAEPHALQEMMELVVSLRVSRYQRVPALKGPHHASAALLLILLLLLLLLLL